MSITADSRETAFYPRLAARTGRWMDLFGYLAPCVVSTTEEEYRACREAAARTLTASDEPAVVVAHSYGGIVTAEAAADVDAVCHLLQSRCLS